MSDGDILASFRHLSAVYEDRLAAPTTASSVATSCGGSGGRHSDFDFVGRPRIRAARARSTRRPSSPTATSWSSTTARWPSGPIPRTASTRATPTGATIERPQTRVTEYALDTHRRTRPTLVWSYQADRQVHATSPGRRVGWPTATRWSAGPPNARPWPPRSIASGTTLWELKNDDGYLSYRVSLAVVPDADRARSSQVTAPAQNASYAYGQVVTTGLRPARTGAVPACSPAQGHADAAHEDARAAHLPGDRDRRRREHDRGQPELHGRPAAARLPGRRASSGAGGAGSATTSTAATSVSRSPRRCAVQRSDGDVRRCGCRTRATGRTGSGSGAPAAPRGSG